ncbi:heme ABC transporter ATP-binding protein [Microbacterium indicum]|uniref:heme ABC transporter ATP-binding protein n=1 Tax=Microbacterium indicum TaxID=358100 RepID=UPI00040ED8E6|nr:heme ABC transporter ATP-binding protein [Microbacterium indicum]
MTALLTARGVTVSRGGRTLLGGVDIALERGEVLALVGPNGAGKSTLLSVLIGDLTPDAGEVRFRGEPIAGRSPISLARSRAVLLQHNAVSFPFAVSEIVEMGRAPWRGDPLEEHDDDAIAEALDDAEMAAFAARRTSELSGGEMARAAFARVLAQTTPVLVLDEPTAALDIRHQERVLARARAHADAGGAVLVVIHDLSLAAAHADRIAVLHEGSVRAVDAPERALDPDLLTEVYRHPIRIVSQPDGEPPLVVPARAGRGARIARSAAAGIATLDDTTAGSR